MDDDRLIIDAWNAVVRLSNADRACRSYTLWAKLNREPDTTTITINKTVFEAALKAALVDNDISDFMDFMRLMERKADERRQQTERELLTLEPEERPADW